MKKERKPIYSAQDARQIPLDSLLSMLGVKRAGKSYHCPFHDDKHPSARIFLKKNLLHCFVCNKSWSTIDLVMHFQSCEVYDAIVWIGDAFCLPLRDSRIRFVNKGRTDFAMKRYVAGKDRPVLEQFIMAPAYADLSTASAKVGVWLLAHMEDNLITISQRELKKSTGCGRFETITDAIQELVDIGLLATQKHGSGKTDYRATPLSRKFRTWAGNNPKYLLHHRTSNALAKREQLTDSDYQSWVSIADGILKAHGSWSCFRRLEGKPEEKTLRFWVAEHGYELAYEALRAYCRDNKAAFGRIGGKEEVLDFVHRRGTYLTTEVEAERVEVA